MTATATAKLILFGFCLMVWFFGVRRLARANLSKYFSSTEAFTGKLYECRVTNIQCGNGWRKSDGAFYSVGANKKGIYMCRPAHAPSNRSWTWQGGYYAPLEQPLFIPWESLLYRNTSILFLEYVRFDVPSVKAVFLIPRKIADQLLVDAGHELPSAV